MTVLILGAMGRAAGTAPPAVPPPARVTPDQKIHQALALLTEAHAELEDEFGIVLRPVADARSAAMRAYRRLRETRARQERNGERPAPLGTGRQARTPRRQRDLRARH